MESRIERFQKELKELKKIYNGLDEENQKKLEELVIMLKSKFIQRMGK